MIALLIPVILLVVIVTVWYIFYRKNGNPPSPPSNLCENDSDWKSLTNQLGAYTTMLQISQKQLAVIIQNLTDKYNADVTQSKQLQIDKVNDQTKRIASDNEKINSLQSQVNAITTELNALQASVPMTPDIQTQIQAKLQTRDSLQGQIAGLRADIQQSQMSIDSVNAYTSEYLANRKTEYDADMQRMTTPVQTQLQSLQSQIQDVKTQMSQLKCTQSQ
jgi:uncharacterized protein YqgV (UPF0045/DUF77 family)